MFKLESKLSQLRQLRNKKPDQLSAKGALSTIENHIQIAYTTLKIIAEHFQGKKIVVIKNESQKQRYLKTLQNSIVRGDS
jgi:hypothetical protein